MKLFKYCLLLVSGTSIMLSGCSTTETEALDKGVAYSQNIKGNYEEIGSCLLPLFKISGKEGQNTTTIYNAGIMVSSPYEVRIYGKKDEINKTYNIFYNHIAAFGNNQRLWAISLKNLTPQENETLFEFKGKTIWGTPVHYSENELKEHIAKCAKP